MFFAESKQLTFNLNCNTKICVSEILLKRFLNLTFYILKADLSNVRFKYFM